MHFDFATTGSRDRYKLLTALVVPRPIALVTTLSTDGHINAAPYSFFNVFSQDPAICVLGIESQSVGGLKDTAANIERCAEFVVNLVDEEIKEAMNVCAIDFPSNISELEEAGLRAAPSDVIETPRIANAPAALECRLFTTLMVGTTRRLVIGEIVGVHVEDRIFEPETGRIREQAYRPIGRLHGNSYCTTDNRFEMIRKSFADLSR